MSTDNKDSLLPCPFCGSANVSSGEVVGSYFASGLDFAQTACNGCGACGPEVEQAMGGEPLNLSERADAAWNRRSIAAGAAAATEGVRVGEFTVRGKGRSSVDLNASHADLPPGDYVLFASPLGASAGDAGATEIIGFVRPAQHTPGRWVFVNFHEGRNVALDWRPVRLSDDAQQSDSVHSSAPGADVGKTLENAPGAGGEEK